MEARKFFHARSIDELVLDCYRLGKFYHVDPDVFLRKPLSVIDQQIRRTDQLVQRMNIEANAASDDD